MIPKWFPHRGDPPRQGSRYGQWCLFFSSPEGSQVVLVLIVVVVVVVGRLVVVSRLVVVVVVVAGQPLTELPELDLLPRRVTSTSPGDLAHHTTAPTDPTSHAPASPTAPTTSPTMSPTGRPASQPVVDWREVNLNINKMSGTCYWEGRNVQRKNMYHLRHTDNWGPTQMPAHEMKSPARPASTNVSADGAIPSPAREGGSEKK